MGALHFSLLAHRNLERPDTLCIPSRGLLLEEVAFVDLNAGQAMTAIQATTTLGGREFRPANSLDRGNARLVAACGPGKYGRGDLARSRSRHCGRR